MQISNRLSIALYIFACMDTFQATHRMTSDFLTSSVQTNPIIIRNILLQLRRTGLVRIAYGTGGITLERALESISFYDVYVAIGPVEHGALLRFHEDSNPNCPASKDIHVILDDKFSGVRRAMEAEMRKYTLKDIYRGLLYLNALQEVSLSV